MPRPTTPASGRPGLRAADRRRLYRRRRLAVLGLAVLVVAGITVLVAGTGGGGPVAGRTDRSPVHPATSRSVVPATTTTVPPTTTTTDPGTLPQTDAFPSASSPSFDARMASLWEGVTTDSVGTAMPAFFPQAAYAQLKSIPDAAGDFNDRLVPEYQADIAAAHALLGNGATTATLVGVQVDSGYGHWIPPGVCDNSIGYFEVPNARVVYSVNGQTDSFGIASMISWRGEWYVVHLGAILRSGGGGEVDDPESGPGSSAYSSTC